jgi:hypothetical protein
LTAPPDHQKKKAQAALHSSAAKLCSRMISIAPEKQQQKWLRAYQVEETGDLSNAIALELVERYCNSDALSPAQVSAALSRSPDTETINARIGSTLDELSVVAVDRSLPNLLVFGLDEWHDGKLRTKELVLCSVVLEQYLNIVKKEKSTEESTAQ